MNMNWLRKKRQDERGVAMMMALVSMLLLSILAAELVYQNQVYSGIVFRQRDQLKARLMARSALRLALLQLRAAEKAKGQLKNMGIENQSLADQIWQTPLILPPPVLPGLGVVDTQNLEAFRKSLGFGDGKLSATITGENDRLDINQLVAVSGAKGSAAQSEADRVTDGKGTVVDQASTVNPEKVKEAKEKMRKAYADVVNAMLEKKRADDDEFRDKYSNLTGEALIGNLLAFIDPETQLDADNRDKSEYYRGLNPPSAPKNAPLTSESEFFMVKGFDETIARLFMDYFTVRPTDSLDVNKASQQLLQAVIPELTNEDAERVIKRRGDLTQGGPFKDAQDFWAFVGERGNYDDAKKRLEESGIAILGGKQTSYRVIVTGESGVARKSWQAAVGGVEALSAAEKAADGANQNPQTPPPQQPAQDTNKEEGKNKPDAKNSSDSLRIIYLKAD